MAVEPNSTLRLLSNVPLNLTYENTIYFGSRAAQSSYFIGKTVETFNDLTYQRVSSNTIRVECNADNVQNCNYMMFINRNYGAKWFYAFVTDIRYVNDNSTEIDYELDDLQSYLFDIELRECFVEREHSATDSVGDNTIPENIPIPAYRYTDTTKHTGLFDDYTLAMCSSIYKEEDLTWGGIQPHCCMVNRIPIGLSVQFIENVKGQTVGQSLRNALKLFRKDLRDIQWTALISTDDIATVYPIPTSFVTISDYDPNWNDSVMTELPTGMLTKVYKVADIKPTSLGAHVVRNKKLLTYPFNKLVCNTFDDCQEYRYEWFTGDKIEFTIYANLAPPTCFQAAPMNYYGDAINELFCTKMEGLPNMPFSPSGLADWITKTAPKLAIQGLATLNSTSVAMEKGKDLIEKGSKMLTPKLKKLSAKGARTIAKGQKMVAGATINPMFAIGETIASMGGDQTNANINGTSSGNIEFASNEKDFFFYQVYPKEEYSEIIDDYFDLFGYTTNKIKVPNIHVRKAWTYTKTANAIVVGGAPASALDNIANIFNNGIRFWNDGNSVGVYTINGVHVDNSPL